MKDFANPGVTPGRDNDYRVDVRAWGKRVV